MRTRLHKPQSDHIGTHPSIIRRKVQPKLTKNKPGDLHEQEADRAAEQVVSKSHSKGDISPASPGGIAQTKPLSQTLTPRTQLKEEENIQAKEEEDVQLKEQEMSPAGMKDPIGEEDPIRAQEVQTKEEENVQLSETEEIQAKEGEDAQLNEEENVQLNEAEDVQLNEEENIQAKEDAISRIWKDVEEPVQQKEDDSVQEKEDDLQQQEGDSVQAKEDEVQQQEDDSVQAKEDEIQQQEDDFVQAKEDEVQQQEDDSVQAKEMDGSAGGDDISSRLAASKGGGFRMDPVTLQEMNEAFGADFSNVRIHTGSAAVQMCKELSAQAFTNGNDIYFNAGKYDPYSKEGKRLLAHELTHTIQQGASSNTIQKAPAETSKGQEADGMPPNPMDITNGFKPTGAWLKYLEDKAAKKEKMIVNVKIGNRFSGKIEVTKASGKKGEPAGYKLVKNKDSYLTSSGWNFFDPLKQAGIEPILALKEIGENTPTIGFLSVKIGSKASVSDTNAFFNEFNKHLDTMGFLGFKKFDSPKITNTFEAGKLNFELTNLKTTVDGFVSAEGNLSVTNENLMFDVSAHIKVPGLAEGNFTIERGEGGQLNGSGEISAEIANVKATIRAEYLEGAISVQGTGRIDSDKFSGEVTFLVTDKKRGDELMNAALGVEEVESTKEQDSQGQAPVKKTAGNQVLVGWGEVTTHITPWLAGTAKIGIDSKGHVTIVGEINVPNEVELMEERGTHFDLFSFEMRAGYGIPLIAQIFIFIKMGMFIRAGFGPLLLKNVKLEGTYSTDSTKLRNFSITGTLNINAFAMIGLKLEAGLGLTILGHDIKGGINLTAAAGLRAYAEATPTLEYKEKSAPGGTKEAETRLKGHFEAAAELFLMLSGSLFYEIDSPWWSPVSDGREDYPFGEMQWPLGDMGVGGDVDWLIGSPDVPELNFSPVSFDKEKFTNNILDDKPYGQKGKSESDEQGTWEDGGAGGDLEAKPDVKDGEGPDSQGNQENLKKLPDEQKYMRALDELSTLENADPKPTLDMVKAKVNEVDNKYGIDKISIKDKNNKAEIFVKHAKQDNSDHKLKISMMTDAERKELVKKAKDDLGSRFKKDVDKEGRMTKDKANDILTDWRKHNKVVGKASLEEQGDHWNVVMDVGSKKKESVKGPLMPAEEAKDKKVNADDVPNIIGMSDKIDVDGGHTLKLEGDLDKAVLHIYSAPKTLTQLINSKRENIQKGKKMLPDYDHLMTTLKELENDNKLFDEQIAAHRAALKIAYDTGKKSDITSTYNHVKKTFTSIAKKLKIVGIDITEWNMPETHISYAMENGMSKQVIAEPLSLTPGQYKGSAATSKPQGWESIPLSLREKGSWVKAHLLNHNLYGPGDKLWNLFPGTRDMNLRDMNKKMEEPAKKLIDKGEVMYYEVKLTYGNSGEYNFIPTKVSMEYGKYDSNKKSRVESYKKDEFTQAPPNMSASVVNNLNTSTANGLNSVAKKHGFDNMGTFFTYIVKYRDVNSPYTVRIQSIENKIAGAYEKSPKVLSGHLENLQKIINQGHIVL